MEVQSTPIRLTGTSPFITDTFRRALVPAILSIGGVMASTLANSLLAGNLLGDQVLAVLSIVNPVYFLFATIGSLAGAGAASVAAWCIGRDDRDGVSAAVTLAALLSLGVSALLALLGLLFLQPLCLALGASQELLEPTRQYLAVYLFSGIGVAGIYPPFFLMKLEGRHRLSMALFIGLALSSVLLELVGVTVFQLGLNGIALGCTVSNVATALIGWCCLLSKNSSFHLCPLSAIWHSAPRLLLAGSPAALNNLCSVLRSVAINLAIVPLAGPLGLTAFSVVSMASNLALIFINGLAQTTGPFVGVFTGERDVVSLRQIESLSVTIGLRLILPFSVLLALLAKPFCALFGVTSPESLAFAVPAVRLFAISLPYNMLSTVLMNYYLSAGRTWLANLLTAMRAYLLVVLSLRLLAPLDMSGVWLSFTAAELLSWLVLGAALLLTQHCHPELSGILLLDRRYQESGRLISFSVHSTQEEIMDASQRISAFCEENQLDAHQSMLISLSLEEMLMSIRDHCFADDPTQSIDVRILIAPPTEPEGKAPIILRIRCAGVPFNPIDYYQQHRESALSADSAGPDGLDSLLDGLEDSLGIAMIVAAAPSVDYKTTFGVNNLTIII